MVYARGPRIWIGRPTLSLIKTQTVPRHRWLTRAWSRRGNPRGSGLAVRQNRRNSFSRRE
jgi:hypothetical protein